MSSYRRMIEEITDVICKNAEAGKSYVLVGDNSSGKSDVLRSVVERKGKEKIYFIDAVNRTFDVSRVEMVGRSYENIKRAGERRRKLPKEMVMEFENNDCRKYDCKEPCEKYKKLRREYVRRGKILVQPFETRVCDTGRTLRIQYDLLKHRYIPSRSYGQYSEEELGIIEGHIKQFSLNEPERRNFEIGKYCKNVIDSGSLMRGVEYNNLIVDLFREKLLRLDMEKALKICRVIYGNSFSQMAT